MQKLIRKNKKKNIIWGKTERKHRKSKETWKTVKQLRLPEKKSLWTNICIETKNGLTFDPFTISEVFKKLFSNLANNLVQKLPVVAEKFGNKSVEDYCNNIFNLNPKRITFQAIQTKYISDLLKICDKNKAVEIDNLCGNFLKDGTDILTMSVT